MLERDRVLAMTQEAAASGVQIGMRRNGVIAIAPGTQLHERDEAKEAAALNDVALALLQYTPEVALADEAGVLLEVRASLRFFQGPRALCRRVCATVNALGFAVRIGMAPTAQGAHLLACRAVCVKSEKRRRTMRMEGMVRLLDALPFTLLRETHPYADWLEGIGCTTLADVRKLPRAGLQRRGGKAVLEALDRAYALAPELFEWLQPPPTFSAYLELPERIEYAEAVLFAARRLIVQMIGWLVARQFAVSRFILLLEHERGRTAIDPTLIEIALAEAAWHEEHLTRLLKERLARLTLPAAIIALRLKAEQVCSMMPPTDSLFPEPGRTREDFHRLLELLTARLGNACVLAPMPVADYRPEVCNAWMPAADCRSVAFNPLPAERPFWLLEKPIALLVRDHRPFYGSPLTLVRGPERIECGWWDSGFAARDYFVAQDKDGACYWIYRERLKEEVHWFLHGMFA